MREHARVCRLGRRLRRQDGFTLVEVMVALGVILAALVALGYTASIGFRDAAFARQRQFGSGLANQTLEQVRALPFDVLSRGLNSAPAVDNLCNDPNITGCSSVPMYGGEPIVNAPTNPTVVPLVPHIQSINDNKTAAVYKVSSYVTNYKGDKNSNTFRVTVLVTWTQGAAGGAARARVQAQSIFYSGTGCLKGNTHPFAAPCQPFFYSDARALQGVLGLTGTIESIDDLDEAKLLLSGPSSDMQIEQVSAVQGVAQTSGASLKYLDGTESTIGATQVTSGADNDPADPHEYDKASTLFQSSDSKQDKSSAATLEVVSSDGDAGTTASTTSASVANLCPDPGGANQLDQQPCGSSNGQQNGTESMTLELLKGGNSLGTTAIATVGASPVPDVAYTDRAVAPELMVCPTTSGVGCVHAAVSRSWGTVTLGGLPPSLTPPAGWQGYLIRGSNLTASATAEAGLGAAAPTVGVQGTVEIWNGAGYASVPLAASPSSLTVAPVDVTGTVNGKMLQVKITPNLKTGGTKVEDDASCGAGCSRDSATVNSPITGTIDYKMYYDDSLIVSVTLTVDLGSTVARGIYQTAPSG